MEEKKVVVLQICITHFILGEAIYKIKYSKKCNTINYQGSNVEWCKIEGWLEEEIYL